MGHFKTHDTAIDGLVLIKAQVFKDCRGFFMETWQKKAFEEMGIKSDFVQDNHSKSKKGVLRGIHFQETHLQAKLVRCISGSILDVAVDLREGSHTFGKSFQVVLSEANQSILYLPEGFGHGFLALEDDSQLLYKTTAYYCPKCDGGVRFDDSELNIDWQTKTYGIEELILSEKDKELPTLAQWLEKRGQMGLFV